MEITTQTKTDIEDNLNEDKARENQARKYNFNRKSTSEQNIHNLRRQFNLGNVEEDLQQELQEVMNSEDILEMMNQDGSEEITTQTIEPDFNPNISHIHGEDNHNYQDIYD